MRAFDVNRAPTMVIIGRARSPRWGRLRPLFLVAGCAAVIATVLQTFGVVVNETPSLPLGLYRKRPHRPVERGSLVLFELSTAETVGRPYACGRLIKQVAATVGDRVTVCAAGVFVNGSRLENSAPMAHDVYDQPLPRLALQNYLLGPGEVFLMSTYHPRSFDGRYFGPLLSSKILAVLTPVWTQKTNVEHRN